MAQPFPSSIHSMSAIHCCQLCSLACLLDDVALKCLVLIYLVKCFYFTSSSSHILTFYSDSRPWSRHISKARLWTAEECCDLRSSDTFLMNPKLQPPGEFYRGRREKWLTIGGCYKLGTFANKNILRWSTRWPALHIEVFLVTFLAYCALP